MQKKKDAASNVVHGITLTHPDKVLYQDQGTTKRDLATYLDAAWPYMKPFVQDRLLSLVRCPDGSGKKCFFQRHMDAGLQDRFKTMDVGLKNAHEDYIYLHDEAALITAAQMGVLEFHIWVRRSTGSICPTVWSSISTPRRSLALVW